MAHPYWPLFDLRIRTPRLELRYPDDELLVALAGVAAEGVHDPDRMPFSEPWTRSPPGKLEVEALQFWWGRRASLTPAAWAIPFAVLLDGTPVGVQDLFANDFPVRRTFETGSWLGIDHHGHGIGTEMRTAVLHFGFDGLGADQAETAAFVDNPESLGVTRKLGYAPNGRFIRAREGESVEMAMFSMTRGSWEEHRRDDIHIDGLEPCLSFLGLGRAS